MSEFRLLLYTIAAMNAFIIGLLIGNTGLVDTTVNIIWVVGCLVLAAIIYPFAFGRKSKKG